MRQEMMGVILFPLTAWFLGGRKTFSKKKFFSLLFFSLGLFVLFLKSPAVTPLFQSIEKVSIALQKATSKGTAFVFGYLGGGTEPFQKILTQEQRVPLFFFQVLPIIIVMGAVSSVMVHLKIISKMTHALSKMARHISFLSRSLASSIVIKLFFSQSETTLFMRNNLKSMHENDILSLMTIGMSTTTLALFGFYASLLNRLGGYTLPHIITASIVNIFSSMALSELVIPGPRKGNKSITEEKSDFDNTAHALSQGACEGWTIMTSIAAIIIASVAMVDLFNQGIGWITYSLFQKTMTLQELGGFLMAPFAWLMGIEWHEAVRAGTVLSEKTLLNETVAIAHMAYASNPVSSRTCAILVYSVCAFSNVLSIGIQISLWSILSPENIQKARNIAPKALWVSILAGALSSSIASFLIDF